MTSKFWKTEYSRRLRNNLTDAEQYLWRYLRGRQLAEMKFRRQHPLGSYIVDFVCLERMLVIELDGSQYAENTGAEASRDRWLQENGYATLRIWNNDIFTNIEGVLETILRALTARTEASPSP